MASLLASECDPEILRFVQRSTQNWDVLLLEERSSLLFQRSPESPISRRRTKRRGLTALNVLVIVALAVGSGVTIPSVKDRKEDFTVVQRGFQPVLSGDSEEPVKVQNAKTL
jgi:hypothetical protein